MTTADLSLDNPQYMRLSPFTSPLKKDGYFTDRFGTSTLLNKDVGFVNPTKTITAAEVQDSLTQLAEILKWYTEV